MFFYKITCTIPEEKITEDEDLHHRISQNGWESAYRIMTISSEFNERIKEDAYYFVSDINESEIKCGIVALNDKNITIVKKNAQSLLEELGFSVIDIKQCETTFVTWRRLLSIAERNRYIEDSNKILENLELDFLVTYNLPFDFSENMIDATINSMDDLNKAEEIMSKETLIPELKRIFQGGKQQLPGHPVHYIIETDIIETRKELVSVLLSALYCNNRLNSRRYSYVDLMNCRSLNMKYDSFYRSCCGGAVVVKCPGINNSGEDDHAESTYEIIEIVSRAMLEYRNQVLTILCLPRECEKLKKLLFENLGSISVVEIREDLVDYNVACGCLNNMCKKHKITPDEQLYQKLSVKGGEKQQYLPDELGKVFDEWYNIKLKTDIFPQYRMFAECQIEAVKDTAKGNAYDELNEMIGLTDAKRVITKALNYYKLQRIYKEKGLKRDRPAMHMVFTGNPGTAKTTVARLFARIMRENELLSKGHLVEVGRGDLVGKYVGWTAQIVKSKFKAARGGVLFIDEAYSLVDDRGGSFGDEAINTIVQEMENHREEMVVIFAGYPDRMEHFLDKNPGLRSRIAFHVPFPNYDTAELCDIAKLIGEKKEIRFTDSAMSKLAGVFDEARNRADFGNGRYVRNIIEHSQMNQADRIITMDPDEVTEIILTSIEAEDIEVPDVKKDKPVKIGFACT